MLHVTERLRFNSDSDLVVTSEGDVKSGADYRDATGSFIEMPDSPVRAAEVETVAVINFTKTGPLETRVDNWLDVHGLHNGKLTEKDACDALRIDYDTLQAEKAASFEEFVAGQRNADHLSARGIIEAHRSRQLAACTTDAERSMLRATFRAEDELRKRS
jgi:hypothetical protein